MKMSSTNNDIVHIFNDSFIKNSVNEFKKAHEIEVQPIDIVYTEIESFLLVHFNFFCGFPQVLGRSFRPTPGNYIYINLKNY